MQRVFIERVCQAGAPFQEALTSKQGEYFWRVPSDGLGMRMNGVTAAVRCLLRARIKELTSEGIDIQDPKVLRNLQLPTLVLRRIAPDTDALRLPRAALKTWDLAIKAYKEEHFAEAESRAREVARSAPKFAPAWTLVGLACNALSKRPEARDAFQRAIAADPSSLQPRVHLVRVEIALQLWSEAVRSADSLIQADTGRRYAEAYLNRGTARDMLNDPAGAQASWRAYLERAPSSHNAVAVKAKLEELNRAGGTAPRNVLPEALLAPVAEEEYSVGAEAWVPGGRQALATMAHMKETPATKDFFLEYSRAVAAQSSA